MITQPDQIDKLPKWLSVLFNTFNRWAPESVQDAIDNFVTHSIQPYEIDDHLPVAVRHTFQAISSWWTRLTIGERSWAEFMREIADDMRGPDALAA